ncbi:MAG: type IV pilus modification protein PilV [Methylococcales bacterium]
MYTSINKQVNHAGFTLFEVLVSLVILCCGMLGMAGLQVSGLRSSATSSYRTDATQLSYDIADFMRANTAAVSSNDFANIEYSYNDTLTDPQKSCVQASITATVASCTASEMASVELYGWVTRARQKLPSASVSVQCNDLNDSDADDCTEYSSHTVSLSWDENVDGSVDTNTFSYTFRP